MRTGDCEPGSDKSHRWRDCLSLSFRNPGGDPVGLASELGGLFAAASRFQIHRQRGEVDQGILVVISFFAAGLYQAAPKDYGVVVRGGEEWVELVRALAMRTGG